MYSPIPRLGNLHTKLNVSSKNSSCEVLLQVKASSVNPSDINPLITFENTVLGSDVAGIVLEVGNDCTRLSVGDAVFGDIGANAFARFSEKKTKELGAYGEIAVAFGTFSLSLSLSLTYTHIIHDRESTREIRIK